MTRTEFVKIKAEILKLKAQKKGIKFISNKLGIPEKVIENIMEYGTEYAPENMELNSKYIADAINELKFRNDTHARNGLNNFFKIKELEDKVKAINKWINESVDAMNNNINLDKKHAKTIKELIERVKALEDAILDNKTKNSYVTKEKPYNPWIDLENAITRKENIKVKVTPEQSKKVQLLCFANSIDWICGNYGYMYTDNPYLFIKNKNIYRDYDYENFKRNKSREIILN